MDAVTLEVARNRLAQIATEMGVILRRTAYSPNIKERADCSAAIFVPSGEMLAQAEHIPVHLGSMPASVAAVIDRFRDGVEPDTQYAVNDPFAGGTHLNDLTLVRPVFHEGGLIGWAANRAHHADVGGEAPGSMPAHATTVDQEGHRVAPVICVRDGSWLPEFLEPFLAATRTPAERRGDLSAQLGANEAGARRLTEVVAREGPGRFRDVTAALLDYGERRMRSALDGLPDGEYRFTDFMEFGGALVPIRVAVTIEDDGLHADFAGSARQVAGNINAVEAVTRSCLYYAVRVATDPTIPANGGCYRPLSLSVPPGSIVGAAPPAAVAAGNVETSQRIADVLLGALAAAAPDRVPAAGQGTMNNILIGNDDFAYYETVAGGQGGSPFGQGSSGIQTGMTNTKNTPVEALESHYPLRVVQYGLRRGSGGAGRHRGGEGIVREIEFQTAATLSLMGERRVLPPWGLAGGFPGKQGEDWLIRSGAAPERLPGKVTVDVGPGDRLLVKTPGGGGWGAE
ncbi:MAG: hydantoinase B/oxoprolinase family protein [Acidimicrobiia bacterium]|nr:hydantoinase B/oxoprolinase family protein [Acidimicrobiia bacterium]MBT8216436.1 hydantoinase B/oxoprolinase family protein [Acidimicrobiia bacterium]NNF09713.1 hydantoinase B/oxoprolinase family protein [Acidimicrobiia bacterium]NNL71391.1 hydantoinase B/oxoprolinase family protein [Acidimicrobiia bacterium]